MRIAVFSALSLIALAACSAEMPDDAASANATARLPAAAPVAAAPLDGPDTGAAIAAETTAVLGLGAQATPAAPAPATGAPLSAMAPDAATAAALPAVDTAGSPQMSDEQSFAAVAERETIASDAARIEANRAQYQVIEPTDLPPRPDGTGPSIVAYALATTNAPGQALYKRTGLAAKSRFEASCAKYGGADLAQEAFLDAGGPKRDRYGMDPDGDGFACYWDPRPFRAAHAGAPEVVTQYEVVETPGE